MATEQEIIDDFHKLYYSKEALVLTSPKWCGNIIAKHPNDIQTYQEVIFDTQPDIIIETGTYHGGSALFYAHMLDLIGKTEGKVITVDITQYADFPKHDKITYLKGRSTDISIINSIKRMIKPTDRVMVILDSNHSRDNVLKELKLYSSMVTKDCYLVVEDSNLDEHPVKAYHGDGGPHIAIEMFIYKNNDYIIDKSREKYLFSFFPDGWLKRVV